MRAAARLAKVAGTALAEGELTLPQYRVLVFLSVRSRPATHVAALLGVSASSMTSVVDGLVARSLVSRSADPTDRRRVMLSLTSEGTRTMHLGDELVGSGLNRLLQRLEPAQAEQALVGLELLNQAMEASLEERFGPQFNESGSFPPPSSSSATALSAPDTAEAGLNSSPDHS